MPKALDLTGHSYGRLTVLSFAGHRKGKRIWRCRCSCGNEITTKAGYLRTGGTRSCGCLLKENTKIYPGANQLPDGVAGFNRAVSAMKRGARERGLAWTLTDEELEKLLQEDCEYCGQPPSNLITIKAVGKVRYVYHYSGLDRQDNEKGYHLDNVVPCCYECNRAKNVRTAADFVSWVTRVSRHLKL